MNVKKSMNKRSSTLYRHNTKINRRYNLLAWDKEEKQLTPLEIDVMMLPSKVGAVILSQHNFHPVS